MNDVSKNRAAEQALRESEEKYRGLFDNALDLIHIVGADGRISDVNDTELATLGYSRRELIGKPLVDIIHPDCREITKKVFAQTMQGKPISVYETAFITSDGERIDIEVNVSPRVEAGKFVSGRAICRDIRRRKRAEEDLHKLSSENRRLAQQVLQVQEQERQGLARELHDELGQGLTMIKTELGRAVSRTRDSKELTKVIQTIDESVDQVIATTRDMLQRLRPGMLDSIGLIGAMIELVKKWEDQQGILCIFDSSGDLHELDENTQLTLFRVLQESLTNIAKYADARQVQVHCHMRKPSGDGVKQRDAVTLSIIDDGVGLPVKRESHQGLGLIGMRERALALGGSLEIKSAPNKGTRIAVTIPLKRETLP